VSAAAVSPAERYVLKDFRGSSHRILAAWMEELPPGSRVLELGPGLGHVARLVNRPDLSWVGLEASLSCLSGLREALEAVAILDLEHLSRLPRGFGVVLAADTLEHLTLPAAMLGLIRDCLPPGGDLFASVPNVANLYVRLNLLFGRFPYAERGILDRTHKTFFTVSSLLEMTRAAGFEVERWTVSTIPLRLAWPRLPRPLLAIAELLLEALTRLLPRLLGYQVLVAARAPGGRGGSTRGAIDQSADAVGGVDPSPT
jgi:2-polyprenyl-3-methyl-5-hydroxy-6-metoxy-1,4-benzoquinol methylase